jgi:glutathionylspermidine synthase
MSLRAGPALGPAEARAFRRRAIFEALKLDPRSGDEDVLATFPLVLDAATWAHLARLAEALDAELRAAEAEVLARPRLLWDLGLPPLVTAALAAARVRGPAPAVARYVRFDFHATDEGWRISEANADVPGGFVEASGVGRLLGAHHPSLRLAGDPAGALADALARATEPGAPIALVHATAYADDAQVMAYFERLLAARGRAGVRASPAHALPGRDGVCRLPDGRACGALLRFFPAEWLPNLGPRVPWWRLFTGARTPSANPPSALVPQSKRFPLVWDRLRTPLPTWRALLPPTRAPRPGDGFDPGVVLKSSLGRLGEDVLIWGATPSDERHAIRRDARRRPRRWAAQRRFRAMPIDSPAGPLVPCVGVYVVDGRAAGAYGRAGRSARVDGASLEMPVMVEDTEAAAARGRTGAAEAG